MKAVPGILIGLMALGVSVGCGSKADDGAPVTPPPTGAGNGTGGNVSGPTGGNGSLGGGPILMPQGASSSGGTGTVDPGMACATGMASAKLSNVRMLVMFDRSTSMNDEADETTGATRWDLASAALSSFFADPTAAGLQVGLRFFPHDSPAIGCNNEACDVMACAQPIVPLATLAAEAAPMDAHEQALVDAAVAAKPAPRMQGGNGGGSQGTPIFAALGGSYAWAAAQHTAAPDEKVVIVLVTDGEPNGCGDEIADIANLAREAFMTSKTLTYAIGLTGSRETDIDAIAAAGETTKGIFITDGATAKQDLLNALAAIRGSALDCDFEMPKATNGMQVDPAKVNVTYTPAGGVPMTLGRVPDVAGCGTTPGWYYDDPTSPSHIMLCPASCTSATVDLDASLEVLLGCVTEMRDPA